MSILIGLILTFGLSYLMYIQRQREGQHSLILPALNLIFPLIGIIWGIKFLWDLLKHKKQINEESTIKYLPPGYRSRKPLKIVAASLIYLFLGVIVAAASTGIGSPTSPVSAPLTSNNTASNQSDQSSSTPPVTSLPESTTVASGQKLKVSYIDVGQADSILVQTPAGKTMLIDAGNNEDADTITSYIKKQGISRLDIVIGTHPHEDHIGSLDTVIKTFDIGQVIMPKKDATTQTYKDVITAISSKGLKITEAKAGLKLDLGTEVAAQLLAPNSGNYEEENDYSAVVKLIYGHNSFLLTGDAQEISENEMIKAEYNLKADVLKVGHHGSHTSSSTAFLAKVSPKYAIISVGKDNSYGHPVQSTLDRLNHIGAKVYRTDQSGTIVVESDGTNITVNTIATEVQPRAPDTVNQPSSVTQPAQSQSGSSTPAVAPAPSPKPTQDVTVYITKTGEKYHTGGCRYLSKSKIPISLSSAKGQGYGPCSVCNPPR